MKLSIITIHYNDPEGLAKTLASVAAQTCPPFEQIIIDGASNPDCKNVYQEYAAEWMHWFSECDRGIYDAQNKGFEKASGDYLLFLNAGDFLKDQEVISKLMAYPFNCDLIACDLILDYGFKQRHLIQANEISSLQLIESSIYHPSTLIRKTLLQQAGGYDLNFSIAADYDFFMKSVYQLNATYQHLPITLSVFDTGGLSSSPEHSARHQQERKEIQEKYVPNRELVTAYELLTLKQSDWTKLGSALRKNKVAYPLLKGIWRMLLSIKRNVSK